MQNSPHIVFSDDNFILCWKPHGLSTTRGKEHCFLDRIDASIHHSILWKEQDEMFGPQGEYGLLNRLDKLTAGLLYFARSPQAKDYYHRLQNSAALHKIYYAQVYGRPLGCFGRITAPVSHHRHDDSRMTTDATRGRYPQSATTYREVCPQKTNPNNSTTRLKLIITQGVRHQIRAHLAYIGCPIVGDWLYMTKSQRKRHHIHTASSAIQLISAGLVIEATKPSSQPY